MTINWNLLLHDGDKDLQSMLHSHHYNQNMSQQMIADHLGVSIDSLKSAAKRINFKWRLRYGKPYSRNFKQD